METWRLCPRLYVSFPMDVLAGETFDVYCLDLGPTESTNSNTRGASNIPALEGTILVSLYARDQPPTKETSRKQSMRRSGVVEI